MKALVVGAGMGGLSMALSLHQAGVSVRVFESVDELAAKGAGINLQPNAVRELDEMGLGAALAATGIPTAAWSCYNKHGQLIYSEPRGLAAGYRWPQYSIHRGELQLLLLAAVEVRIGADNVLKGHHLASFDQDASGVVARFVDRTSGRPLLTERGDVLIGADGLHSTVRAHFYPDEGPPRYCGEMQWRASVEAAPFLDGRTQAIIGHRDQRFIAYPMSARPGGRVLTNWIAELRLPQDSTSRADWNRQAPKENFARSFASWRFPWLDIPALIDATPEIWEFPKVDRDPVSRWSFGRVTLLGDAAHPMLPTGSQAGSQAVVDGRVLTRALLAEPAVEQALRRYESERLQPMSEITLKNREMGPELAMHIAEERAPQGFSKIEEVISREEMAAITDSYKRKAGLDTASVNGRPSFLEGVVRSKT
jgi:2-polyprenyl-6-methoxyphenol hydroxylase-like FAD-dependent oxidoreductase